MTQEHKGRCLCGDVTFSIHGQIENFFLCHCSRCRKASGSAHSANLFSTVANLEWLSGETLVTRYQVPDSRHSRCFCKQCGSPLPQIHKGDHGQMLLLPAGSLDTPISLRPDGHIFCASRAEWDNDLGSIAEFDSFPG